VANNDRISEVYKGEIWASANRQRARRRIDWLASQAVGEVVDVGCSQGITSILMARAGHRVTGVDIEQSRIEYAEGDRLSEAPEVRDRLSFVHTDGESIPLPDSSVDSAILGEIIEHLEDAHPVMSEVVRVLRPEGRAVLTTPFGYSPHHDHHHTFYIASGLDVVTPWLTVEHLEVEEGYLRLVARPGPMSAEDRDSLVVRSQPLFEAYAEQVEIAARERGHAVGSLRARLRAVEDRARSARLAGVAQVFELQADRAGETRVRAGATERARPATGSATLLGVLTTALGVVGSRRKAAAQTAPQVERGDA
jgi:2-polyprenyl-6-hydroxyphenyl methylase/3-demethylubiquinone-9 3-methyltransferase